MGKKFLLFIMTAVTVLILGAGSYAFNVFTSTSASIYEDIDRNPEFEQRLKNIDLKDGDPISVLIMGLDTQKGEKGGRADTMVLLTINPEEESVQMVSIPRDTYVKVRGAEENKMNSTYQVGGTEMTIKSIEEFLDVPVDYFVKVNMQSFEGIVDALDGITVENDLEFDTRDAEHLKEDAYFPKGEITLNGKEALLYARMRELDPRGDFGRQKRQRQVIEQVIRKGASISSVTKFGDIFDVVEDHVKTNLSFNEMWKIQSNYKNARANIEQHKIEGTDKKIDGVYYYMPDKKQVEEISYQLNSHLGLADQASDAAKRPIEENVKKEDKEGNLFTNKEPKRESVKEPVTEAEPRPDKEDPPEEKEPETSTEEPPEEKAPETPPEEPTPPEEDEGEAESATDESEDAALEQTQPESSQDQGGNGDPNVKQVITDNWPVVPTEQENHTHITFEKGSLDWKEMTTAIAAGAGLSEDDMIVWWAAGEGTDKAIATVTNQAQTENYRVQVTWVDDAGYKPVKTEILYENDQKN